MSFKVIGKAKDFKTGANVIYCQSSLDKYLEIIGDDFENFSIQRRRESHKAYKRLRQDIIEGTLLPSITLAVKHHLIADLLVNVDNVGVLESVLSKKGVVDILDGLQRTYIIKDIKKDGVVFKEGQHLLLEYWLEGELSKLIYRMIVLNSGQKAMSMRHQMELLFMSLRETIQETIPGIEVILEKDTKRRTQASKYHLSTLAASYQAYLTSSHEIDKENIVAQKIIETDILDSSEAELADKFNIFVGLFNSFHNINSLCWDRYYHVDDGIIKDDAENNMAGDIPQDSYTWLGSENVMLAFFSAVSQFDQRMERVNAALHKLSGDVQDQNVNDPLGLVAFENVKKGLNPRKTNIGFATRKLISTGFKEYFRDEGETSLGDCWMMAAE